VKADLTSEFAKLVPWIFKFRIDGTDYGGEISALGDMRVERFFRFAPNAANILELGALEGAQTFILAERSGVKKVIALKGRAANLRKARFLQELLRVENAEFAQANLEETDLSSYGKFDAVFCCGLLYHLPKPWKLIQRLPSIAPFYSSGPFTRRRMKPRNSRMACEAKSTSKAVRTNRSAACLLPRND
jgi:SAM-dependent methyltransferase